MRPAARVPAILLAAALSGAAPRAAMATVADSLAADPRVGTAPGERVDGAQVIRPSPRYLHTATYDPVRRRMIVIGGTPDGMVFLGDAWVLDLSGSPAWSALAPSGTAPSARASHSAIYDPRRDRIIVFGGYDANGRLNDLWSLSLAGTPGWAPLAATGTPPSARNLHSAIYDPVADRMIVFGGYGSAFFSDVWELDLAPATPAWHPMAPAGPQPGARRQHGAIYDPVRGRMVVSGGLSSLGSLDDVWALSLDGGPAWTRLAPAGTSPLPNDSFSAIYEASSDQMVLFGGATSSGFRNDVWSLSLGVTPSWSPIAPAGTLPSPRMLHSAVVDSAGARMIIFGGWMNGSADDVWSLSLTGTPTWTFLDPAGVPPDGPDPTFTQLQGIPSAIQLGQEFSVTVSVRNDGLASDYGRIVASFPALTDPADVSRVASGSFGDLPGFGVTPAGEVIVRRDCSFTATSYLMAEYDDDAWGAYGTEVNTFSFTVRPRELGPFPVLLRGTMHASGGDCAWVNDVPSSGDPGTDQEGWEVKAFTVVVGPVTAPLPAFTAQVGGFPLSIALGETFQITASVWNNGGASDDGRVSIAFPGLADPGDAARVSSASAGDAPGYLEWPAGSSIPTAACQTATAGYLVTEYADQDWLPGETNSATVVVQPATEGVFTFDVHATMHVPSGGSCEYRNAVPVNGVDAVDQQGWAVKRFSVTVLPPAEPLPPPTVTWTDMTPPSGGPTARTGATGVYHSAGQALIVYGGADIDYRSDVWSLPLAAAGGWSQISAGGPIPQKRILHSMIYNELDNQVVIFGGYYEVFLNDMTVMVLTGTPWWFPNPGSGIPPSPRGGHAAVYDPVRHRMLVIGGYDGAMRSDVWEYAPPHTGTWRELAVTGTPMPGRSQAAAVYDPVRDRVIVIGGDGGPFLNDVWAIDLAGPPAWEPLTPTGTPPSPRREHTAIYDPLADRVVLFGGFDGARRGDLWELRLRGDPAWGRLTATNSGPSNRFGHVAVYDPPRHRMVLFGGSVGTNAQSREVWALGLDTPTPVALSLTSTDVSPDRVRLTWTGEGLARVRATLSRTSGEDGDWVALGSPAVEGGDRLVYEDRAVTPGARYGYRLAVSDGSGGTELGPVWVTVPERAILGLAGAMPNPADGGLTVAFSLANERPASLVVYDLSGRVVAAREVGSLGPGDHRLRMVAGRGLPAGLYLVRLEQDRQAFTRKACVVR